MGESLKQKTVKGTIWSAIESFSVQGIQFIVMLIMARLLTPSDYGIVGMIAIFMAVSDSLINSGFSQALIRKTDRTEIDNSTVFYFNIVIGFILYGILFFTAPLIARFYNEPILIPVLRIFAIILIFNSVTVVQIAQFTIKIDFKTQAKATLSSVIISGGIGIFLAYKGYGVWALVIQQLIKSFLNTIILWFLSSWRPVFAYSWQSFREMFKFGSKLLASGLIDTLYNNIYALVIGKVYRAADLGYYSRSSSFSNFASASLTGIIGRVSYPVLCSIQNDDQRLCEGYSKLMRVQSFIIFPLMIGMASVAKPMILTLLTEKWIYSAVLLVPICFAGMWYPVHALNLSVLKVKGRSDLFLKLEIIKKILGIAILVGTVPLGLYWMCWGSVLSSIICLLINTHYTKRLINLGFLQQIKDLLPTLSLSAVMGVIVWLSLKFLYVSPLVKLIIGILVGALIYITGAKLFRFPEFLEIRSLLKRN